MSLLHPDEPPAATVLRPQGHSDLFLTCDHASLRIPKALGELGLSAAERASHIAWDIGAAEVARRICAALDATLVLQNYSRLVIDCNRPPGSPGSIPTRSEYAQITANEGLDATQRQAREREIFVPYHEAIRELLEQRAAAGRRSILVAMHSFTPVYLGVPRRWQVGLMFRSDRRLGELLLDSLSGDVGLQVGENEPYAITDVTDHTIPVHAESRRLIHVGIEVRQDLIADEVGQQAWAGRLTEKLGAAARVLAGA